MSNAKWYQSRYFVVAAFLAVGPFALPLVWFNPAITRGRKIAVTVLTLICTAVLAVLMVWSLGMVKQYYSIGLGL